MLQSKARLLELNAKLADTLTDKGVTATADETTTSLINKVAYITSGDDSVLRGLIQRDLTDLIIPYGTILIGESAFSNFTSLRSVDIPNTVWSIGNSAFNTCSNLKKVDLSKTKIGSLSSSTFRNCEKLEEIILPEKLKSLGVYTFYNCKNLKSIYISEKVDRLGNYIFYGCSSLATINLPNSLTSIGGNVFDNCSSLKDVTLGDGFNANNLNLSASTLYTRETILQWLNALADRTGQTAYKLIIGATNLAKLTEQDILIATNKNWTLS